MKILKQYSDFMELVPGHTAFVPAGLDFWVFKKFSLEDVYAYNDHSHDNLLIVQYGLSTCVGLVCDDMMLVISKYIHCDRLYLYVMTDHVIGWCSFNIMFLTGTK